MSWKDRYRPARFRKATFYVDSIDSGPFGRRLVKHVFPGRDQPFIQDMGKENGEFTIEGFVLGDDYLTQRDILLEACEKEGQGELVHPFYGSFIVRCSGVRFRDTSKEQRIGKFTLTFIIAKERNVIPVLDIDTIGEVLSQRQKVLNALSSWFTKAYNIVSQPFVIVASAHNTVSQFTYEVERSRRIVGSVSDFARTLDNTVNDISRLLYEPIELFDSLSFLLSIGTIEQDDYFPSTIDNSKSQFNELRELFTFVPSETVEVNSPSYIISKAAQMAALTTAAGLLVVMEFESLEEAFTFRNIVLNKMDELSSSGMADEVYDAFQSLRKAIVNDIDLRSITLSRLIDITLQETMPAIVLSNMLYGSIDKEVNIYQRNVIDNPGFIPGGQLIEVLSYVEK